MAPRAIGCPCRQSLDGCCRDRLPKEKRHHPDFRRPPQSGGHGCGWRSGGRGRTCRRDRRQALGMDEQARIAAEIGVPMARVLAGLDAPADQRMIDRMVANLPKIGGSNAQRDFFVLALAKAVGAGGDNAAVTRIGQIRQQLKADDQLFKSIEPLPCTHDRIVRPCGRHYLGNLGALDYTALGRRAIAAGGAHPVGLRLQQPAACRSHSFHRRHHLLSDRLSFIARPLQRLILPKLPLLLTGIGFGNRAVVFALYVMAHLIAGLPAFLGFITLTWASLIGHIFFGTVVAFAVRSMER
ncbi:hypothetical protein DdX_21524 [Ditylenchus destructor]|uniref:Uncharacterized protein n=1 Tax=Ditylenchus destructor TaxID=166010 RepID=A0AAD4QVH2_9BILA|nr:hypothetical protein DdX_21524 [Ditylenchus destructor]